MSLPTGATRTKHRIDQYRAEPQNVALPLRLLISDMITDNVTKGHA